MTRRIVVRLLVALAVCAIAARGMQRDDIETRRRLSALPLGTPATTVDSTSAADVRENATHTSFSYHITMVMLLVALLLGAIDGVTALILFVWPDRGAEPPFPSLVPRNGPE
jgi:hypothetical protein